MVPTLDTRPVTFRLALRSDQKFRWEMLYEASHSGEEGAVLADLVGDPALALYVEGWGKASDLGLIADVGGMPVGAVWLRCIRAFGYV